MRRSYLQRKGIPDAFTLVELLLAMAIVLILAGLATYAGVALFKQAARKRAAAEIQAISAALESYKADNGSYPISDTTLVPSVYINYDGMTAGDEYQLNSAILFTALNGQAGYSAPPQAGVKSYMQFKVSQVGNPTSTGTTTGASTSYVKDPWNASYGYSTGSGTTTLPNNGFGNFDLWTTAGVTKSQAQAATANATGTSTWITNWTQ